HREVWVEPAAAQLSALRARNGDNRPFRFPIATPARKSVSVVGAVTLRAEDIFVHQRSGKQSLGEVLDLFARHFAGVVFVERQNPRPMEVEGEGVHVSKVEHELLFALGYEGVLEGAKSGRKA